MFHMDRSSNRLKVRCHCMRVIDWLASPSYATESLHIDGKLCVVGRVEEWLAGRAARAECSRGFA